MEDKEFYKRIGDGPEMTDDFFSDNLEGNNSAEKAGNPGGSFRGRNRNSGNSDFLQKKHNNYVRNQRYSEAYGSYGGGYGPGQGYGPYGPPGPPPMGPPDFYGPPLGFGPPSGPTEFWGRGYNVPGGLRMGRGGGVNAGSMKRTDNRAIVYMKRCGVAKEHLKNLPRDLLNLIEPQYCGLCGHNFESYAISRMHYISKNHLKKMKKWVTNKDSSYQRSSKEVPMKARELYCELCDVHITSTAHAESHYAGKPHRAIVLGRKNPKNPFLLQNTMKDRLDQLIRREKKNLKALDGAEPEATEDDVGEAKSSTNPDLYCEICKTSVTCSEQMTMHLNGKKHLAKEKHHILKVMKAGTEKNKNTSNAADSTVVIEDDEDEEVDGDEDEEYMEGAEELKGNQKIGEAVGGDTDDWVNGSGDNWDETH